MEQFLNGAGSKAFDIALKSGMSFATSYAMKRMARMIDDQINKTITTVVTSTANSVSSGKNNENLKKLKNIRDKIELKMMILTAALDQILIIGSKKGIIGIKTCENCNKLISPIVENLENWINEDSNSIEKSMVNLEKDIDTVCSYLQLSSQLLITLNDVDYEKIGAEGNSLNVSKELLLKSGLIIGDVTNSNAFEVSFYELTSFHENVAVWKEVCRRACVTFETTEEYSTKLNIKQDFNDDMYHDLEEETEFETSLSIDSINKIFHNKDSSSIGFGDVGDECIVLKCDDNKWFAIATYHPYQDSSDTSSEEEEEKENEKEVEEEREEDFKSVQEKRTIKHKSIEMLSIIIKLLKIQYWEQKPLLNLSDEILHAYIKQGDMMAYNSTKTEENMEDVTKGVNDLNI